jgi:5-hydroxyisourate hydrolase
MISTHVLDTARGQPAAGVPIVLEKIAERGGPTPLASAVTDADGRVRELLPSSTKLAAGTYRLTFETGAYFAALGMEGFYPRVTVLFDVRDPVQHHHVPLLLSPFGYATYRGS